MKSNNNNPRNNNQDNSEVNTQDPEPVEVFDDLPADEEGSELEAEKDIIDNQMTQLEDFKSQLEDCKAQVEKEKKEYLYLMAEFDNFRKRTIREKSDIIKNASEKAMADLLPIIDDFERSIDANRENNDAQSIKEGTELIYNKLIKYLEDHGVKAIDSDGKPFDTDLHEAIAQVPGDPEKQGMVVDTLTKGYTMGDKVIRHAKVAVGQ